jgi:aryl-alcohol dehydrogenase-like predicted oxidoreductase
MRYRIFGEHSGLRVSELVLGAGMFGTRWGHGAQPDESRQIIEAYAEAGGNFIDTANGYQFGESEEILGDVLQGRRDDFVLATKYTAGEVTPTEEIVRGFDDLVRAGKILYAGLSDFPAWRVARAATIAELRGAVRIAGLQIEYSLVERTAEHELLPAGQALGLGTVAWSPLGGGLLTGKYRKEGETGRREGMGGRVFQQENSPQRTAIVDAVLAVAKERGVTPGEVAIAWVAAKGAIPIIGPRTLGQLTENLAAAELSLSSDEVAKLDAVSAISPIFPYTVIEGARPLFTAGKEIVPLARPAP